MSETEDKQKRVLIYGKDEEENTILYGDIESYLDYLIDENQDSNLVAQFLAAYPQFVDSSEVLTVLLNKFYSAPEATDEDVQPRERVLKFLYKWVASCYKRDFNTRESKGKRNFDRLIKMVNELNKETSNKFKLLIVKSAPQIRDDFQRLRRIGSEPGSGKGKRASYNPLSMSRSSSSVHFMKSDKRGSYDTNSIHQRSNYDPNFKFSLKDIDPSDLAKQLTLIEWKIFSQITDEEFYDMNWTSKKRHQKSPHILKLIERFNKVSYWVATQIVMASKTSDRVNILKKLIKTADEFREIGNFNGVMEFLGGLNMWTIKRLKDTWSQLPSSAVATFESLDQLMENQKNYQNYRQALKACKKSALPYIGIYLRDLTFSEEGNEDFLEKKEEKIINIGKLNIMGSILVELRAFQQKPYEFEVNLNLQEQLEKLVTLPEELLAKHSFLVEPENSG